MDGTNETQGAENKTQHNTRVIKYKLTIRLNKITKNTDPDKFSICKTVGEYLCISNKAPSKLKHTRNIKEYMVLKT